MQYLTEEALLKDSGIGVLPGTISGHNSTNLNEDGEPHASRSLQQQILTPPYDSAALVHMLFKNYDICIFCGAKFIG